MLLYLSKTSLCSLQMNTFAHFYSFQMNIFIIFLAYTKEKQTFNLSVGYIITMEEKETITTDYGTIYVIPAWEWLLQG